MTTASAIRKEINAIRKGVPFTPATFFGMGSRAAIDMALMREVKAGTIIRVSRGIYTRAQVNEFGRTVTPPAEKLALAVNMGEKLGVSGAAAAHSLGLTTQMPTQPIFYTTGRSRTINVGRGRINIVHRPWRQLALAGRAAGMGLAALWYLGRSEVSSATLSTIKRNLPEKEFRVLLQSKSLMPSWMAVAVTNYEKEISLHGSHKEKLLQSFRQK